MALNSRFGHKKIAANARGEQRKCVLNAERREQEKPLFATPQKDELVSVSLQLPFSAQLVPRMARCPASPAVALALMNPLFHPSSLSVFILYDSSFSLSLVS